MMRSKSFEKQCIITEKWFKTKYVVNELTPEQRHKIVNPNVQIQDKKLDLPPRNNLIATNFALLPENKDYSKNVQLLKQWPGTHLWYKKDDKFGVPKAIVSMRIFTKYIKNQDENCCESGIFISVWQKILIEYMREFKYMAEIAQLDFQVGDLHDNLNFIWTGFNDSMLNFISETIDRVLQMKNENLSIYFEQVKEKLFKEWENFHLQ